MKISNRLLDLPAIAITIVVLRHGHSRANEAEIIVSDPANGIPEYGLSAKGKTDVREWGVWARESGILDESTLIFSSPFRRAGESAELVAQILGSGEVVYDDRLRERYFGDYELTSSGNYAIVWEDDAQDPGHVNYRVESALAVLERMTALVVEFAEKYAGKRVLLVTHGDPAQILETGFLKQSPQTHRSLKPLQTAEIRELRLAGCVRKALKEELKG